MLANFLVACLIIFQNNGSNEEKIGEQTFTTITLASQYQAVMVMILLIIYFERWSEEI